MATKKETKAKVVKEPTIHDKYREHLDRQKQGIVRDLKYKEAMEMLRFIQSKRPHVKLGVNMSCSSCLYDLVRIFASLEE